PTATCDALKVPGAVSFTPVISALDLAQSGLVQGIVRDVSFVPVVGAAVTARNVTRAAVATFTTDGSNGEPPGQYSLRLDPGGWVIAFEAPGFNTVNATIVVPFNSTFTVTQDAQFP